MTSSEVPGAFGAILIAVLLGAMSPGPSFFLIARTSLAHSRRHALVGAFGMGLGGAVFSGLAALGLVAVLSQWDILYAILKCAGGLYIVRLGVGAFTEADSTENSSGQGSAALPSLLHSFWIAFATQLANAKTVVVYASIFAALLPADAPFAALATLPGLVFLVETFWYGLVAIAMSSSGPRTLYVRWRVSIDRAAGALLAALGVKLVLDGVVSLVAAIY